ncbi:oxalate--CoA ligase [Malassezia sp. CBS 17886]|nr:oxalate--CoA ligase [Malassezia sp. CBS 17886]
MATLGEALFTPRPNYSPDAVALQLPPSAGGACVSYAQLAANVAHLQEQLGSLNLPQGAVVSSTLINNVEFVAVFLATAQQSFIAAPLNPNYKEAEVHFYLDDTASSLLIAPRGTLAGTADEGALAAKRAADALGVPVVEAALDTSRATPFVTLVARDGPLLTGKAQQAAGSDTALVLHTSGTTGRPKAVPLTHANLVATMHNIVDTYALTNADKSFLVMPLFHVHGLLCGLLAPLQAGGTVVIPTRFSASSFWSDLAATHANWYTAVPTIHQIVLTLPKPDPAPPLRFVRSCSSSLSPATFHALEAALGVPVLEAYAMTEAAHQMTSNPRPDAARKPGTVGIGHGVEVKILDGEGHELPKGSDGEVCVRGPNVTAGYRNNEEANRQSFFRTAYGYDAAVDGFLRTGDQGHVDGDGYLVLTGRIKELINRSGEKISPLEVDAALLSVPSVREAVSFAIPHEMYGETVAAAVVLGDDAQGVDAASIRRQLSDKLIRFKVPEKIWIAESIPKTCVLPADVSHSSATGKIQRRNVAATFNK